MNPSERMRTLLRYANSAEVARGLTAAGYPVSGPTVSRWAKGNNVTPWAVRHVADLLGEARKAPRPEWAEGLLEDVPAIRAGVDELVRSVTSLQVALGARQAATQPAADDPVDDQEPVTR